jgi:hypothetical protein
LGQPGTHAQFTGGIFHAKTTKNELKNIKRRINIFFINVLMVKNKGKNGYDSIGR